ncbi:MAG: class I SAM-dependent methyltransferase [Planctomycetota bacterium]|nr:class I SAM-dependent methyltransferase [Planctomycetota bacterium]
MAQARFKEDEITYQLFDINPAEFYKRRFLYPQKVQADQEGDAVRATIGYQKTQFVLDAIKDADDGGRLRILEVGCGSGIYGARVKHFFPHSQVLGIDMSDDCIAMAKENGYDDAVCSDVASGLPYEDGSFDFVFTMDFFGHIEFSNKNPIIAEIHRVTRKGGHGFHGIEAGWVDYFNCDPKDPDDFVRRYVYEEGHVGVETIDTNVERFGKWFQILSAFPWPIRPFLYMDGILPRNRFGEQFTKSFAQFDGYASRVSADIVMGYCNNFFTQKLFEIFGKILTGDAIEKLNLGQPMRKFAEAFLINTGFAMLAVRRQC